MLRELRVLRGRDLRSFVAGRQDVFFGTNDRNRRGLSTRILCSVASLTPAYLSFGTNCTRTVEKPFPQLALSCGACEKSAASMRLSSYPALSTSSTRRTLPAS